MNPITKRLHADFDRVMQDEAVNGICCMEDNDMHNVVPEDREPPTTWTLGGNPINQDDEE